MMENFNNSQASREDYKSVLFNFRKTAVYITSKEIQHIQSYIHKAKWVEVNTSYFGYCRIHLTTRDLRQ